MYHVNWGLGPGLGRQTWKDWMKPVSKLIQISPQTSTNPFWLLFDPAPWGQSIHSCDNLSKLCFCSLPFKVYGFSKSSSKWEYRCLSWWSIQDTTLFLLSLSTLSQSHSCVYTSERYCKIRSGKQVKNCSSENSSKASWKLCLNSGVKKSLVNQQSKPIAIACNYHGNTPDTQDHWSEVSQLRSHLPANGPPNNAGLSSLNKVGGLF